MIHCCSLMRIGSLRLSLLSKLCTGEDFKWTTNKLDLVQLRPVLYWLVVSAPLENIGQLTVPNIGGKHVLPTSITLNNQTPSNKLQ